jgi:hypothetical protein
MQFDSIVTHCCRSPDSVCRVVVALFRLRADLAPGIEKALGKRAPLLDVVASKLREVIQ